ncbi:MAG: aminotransferase class V-fold PLP-dependent enzyme [Flavobacteriaceae bacterium]|nr:aminotransferase class V-fold PLP-dependent enzyme [Flavobacteriaceae bacterium]
MENYFKKYRDNIVGINHTFKTPYGEKKIIYTDWTASGRLYRPIEEKILNEFGPFVANTHTETSVTGSVMTKAYHKAREIIKKHVNANDNDILITEGSGMTGVINKLQRILGLRICDSLKEFTNIPNELKPIVFITHMEHHSNQTTWLESIADVEIIHHNTKGLVCLKNFNSLLEKYKNRKIKIASVTACSNVTGIQPDVYKIAEMIHQNNGLCFVDYACAAPYVNINMHKNKNSYFDAIFFSPHKFLGGPASSGVLIFNKELYKNTTPDNPGGGTVNWTNPWGEHSFINDIEVREDGGTPAFLQTIKIALAIQLKEEIGVENMLKREHEINTIVFDKLSKIDNLHILAGNITDRLGVFSFYIDHLHFNLGVKILNDRFGIQTRGGCSCAGTYGHFLLHVNQQTSNQLIHKIEEGCFIEKPGWIRMSIHPTMTNKDVVFVCDSIIKLSKNYAIWKNDYKYCKNSNEFKHKNELDFEDNLVASWFL